jgi:hypothetical protein
MTSVTLSSDLLNPLLQYLSSRPYAEVFTYIQGIQQAAAQQIVATAATATPDDSSTSTQ